ncbi:hypothetical protein FHL15_006158 [Xylaria flabelliformis]|uniref:Uncharacterized protein n=1 Tax=Xylaria flabelliformis TaxID=2512241 RepID=A0A553HYJ9_9PEZI|nr:hypothetical protein FHL15_006158 [Xylaria flabelliformis]
MGIDLAFFSTGSLGWQAAVLHGKERVAEFLSNPLRQSRVPQFILDAQHPWILENQGKLERLPDAESFLCSQPQRSGKDLSENGLDVPPDLFEYLEIDNRRLGVDRPGWPNAVLRLRELHRCSAALSQVKTFKTAIRVHRGEYSHLDKRILEPHQPPREALDLFVDVLGNMTNLEILKWDIPVSDACYIERHFVERGLVLPSVRRLEPGSVSPFLVRTCPNITALEEKSYTDAPEALLQAATFAPKLTRFAMSVRHGWDLSLVQGITGFWVRYFSNRWNQKLTRLEDFVLNLPGIESLGLWGGLSRKYDSRSSLEESSLTVHASDLDVGWSGGPKCGRPFMGPRGREKKRIVLRKSAEATDRAAALVVEFLPHLTGFSIGDTQANLTRDENGTVRASFPWTGRIDQWVMECLPLEPDDKNLQPQQIMRSVHQPITSILPSSSYSNISRVQNTMLVSQFSSLPMLPLEKHYPIAFDDLPSPITPAYGFMIRSEVSMRPRNIPSFNYNPISEVSHINYSCIHDLVTVIQHASIPTRGYVRTTRKQVRVLSSRQSQPGQEKRATTRPSSETVWRLSHTGQPYNPGNTYAEAVCQAELKTEIGARNILIKLMKAFDKSHGEFDRKTRWPIYPMQVMLGRGGLDAKDRGLDARLFSATVESESSITITHLLSGSCQDSVALLINATQLHGSSP